MKKINLKTMNFYSDESRHLMNDDSFMVLACVYCRKDRTKNIINNINRIKSKYSITANTELKWNKVSPATLQMYKEIFRYLCNDSKLKIRILVSNKNNIVHKENWYNRAYYHLFEYPINNILKIFAVDKINVFSDYKDTHSHELMKNTIDFIERHFKKIYKKSPKMQSIVCDSYNFPLIHIADILAGAASYKVNGNKSSSAKLELIKYIEELYNVNLKNVTREKNGEFRKCNIFVYDPENAMDIDEVKNELF